jgi:hypothetical protein
MFGNVMESKLENAFQCLVMLLKDDEIKIKIIIIS